MSNLGMTDQSPNHGGNQADRCKHRLDAENHVDLAGVDKCEWELYQPQDPKGQEVGRRDASAGREA